VRYGRGRKEAAVTRQLKYNMAIYAFLVVVMIGIFALMTALGDKVARWGGYAESLPLIGLFILFTAGNLIFIPPRRSR
jgi:hypothetical protein